MSYLKFNVSPAHIGIWPGKYCEVAAFLINTLNTLMMQINLFNPIYTKGLREIKWLILKSWRKQIQAEVICTWTMCRLKSWISSHSICLKPSPLWCAAQGPFLCFFWRKNRSLDRRPGSSKGRLGKLSNFIAKQGLKSWVTSYNWLLPQSKKKRLRVPDDSEYLAIPW